MKFQKMNVSKEVISTDDDGSFNAILSTFNNYDSVGDVIQEGAFDKWLSAN